jgi:hypothetical protein
MRSGSHPPADTSPASPLEFEHGSLADESPLFRPLPR